MPTKQDIAIIRELARQKAEIAALPVQEEKRALWRKLNGLKPDRPTVAIDQVCWNEMNVNDELTLRCADPELRGFEDRLRRELFQWRHFPGDMVVDPYIHVSKAIHNTGFGVRVQERVAVTDPTSGVVGHKYTNQFETEEDLEKIQIPRLTHDETETARRLDFAHELFDGIIDVRLWGVDAYLSLWDPISTWMSVESALLAIVDRPDYVHRLVGRMTDGYMAMFDQAEAEGLLCGPQNWVHCTGAFTDELPAPGYNPEKPRTKDMWAMGLAQMFSTVSPKIFKEFEVDYVSRLCARFGLVYYGCCDPLDGKMNEVRMIPNVRKVSMSPWVNEERGAAEIAGDYVYSRKPSPAFLAHDSFDAEAVRSDLQKTREICKRYGCPLEYILKDISTVRYKPQRLFKWSEVAMEVACG
ncbi:MAG TPA: hypothetical protein PK251_00435 [Candidatus Latescibacteria bacterium]|nr:hypothetical protein [Candidatus Latescibacterota bacterium]HOF60275.1 hypothetical protein [Candidatus Latescibacterota bacterium]HOS63204.1 hypothetical protein [Candidatus Latescibacterota bacterium]HPK75838.1 hypothetical protein [Candidatus Latescibacterota bacterium]